MCKASSAASTSFVVDMIGCSIVLMLSIGLDALGDDGDDDDDDLIVYSEEKYEIDRNYRALLPLLQAESDREYVYLLDRCSVIRLLAPTRSQYTTNTTKLLAR